VSPQLAPDFRPQYHQLHRVGRPGWWRSLVGALVALVLVFGLVPLVAGAIAFAALMAAGNSTEQAGAILDVTAETTPTGLALLNIVIAMAIPVTWAVTWWLHRLKPRWLSSVAPRLRWVIFALFHGLSQDAPVFFDRFAFGVVAGILVIRTGGLEAAIAMHVLNNFLAFGLALAFGDLTTALTATGGSSWWMILSTLTQSLVYLALASWVAKGMGLVNVGPPVGRALPPPSGDPVLEGSAPRV